MNFTFSCVILSNFPSFCFLPNKKGRLSAAFLRFLHFTRLTIITSHPFFLQFLYHKKSYPSTTPCRTPRGRRSVPEGYD